jgi:hypothetical protein
MKADLCANEDVIFVLTNLIEYHPLRMEAYYSSLKMLGLLLINDKKYFNTPIDPEAELAKLDSADMEMCGALLTMLLREDCWFDNAFDERLKQGWPQKIVRRMIGLAQQKQFRIQDSTAGKVL